MTDDLLVPLRNSSINSLTQWNLNPRPLRYAIAVASSLAVNTFNSSKTKFQNYPGMEPGTPNSITVEEK